LAAALGFAGLTAFFGGALTARLASDLGFGTALARRFATGLRTTFLVVFFGEAFVFSALRAGAAFGALRTGFLTARLGAFRVTVRATFLGVFAFAFFADFLAMTAVPSLWFDL